VPFGDDHVELRGASWATGRSPARRSRNLDHPQRRPVIAGVRPSWGTWSP